MREAAEPHIVGVMYELFRIILGTGFSRAMVGDRLSVYREALPGQQLREFPDRRFALAVIDVKDVVKMRKPLGQRRSVTELVL